MCGLMVLFTNYPLAPDRTGKITKFNLDAFAILAATPLQSLSVSFYSSYNH